MKLSRNFTLALQFILDECLPPVLRDSRWLMWLPFRLVCKDQTRLVLDFKEDSLSMNAEEFRRAYELTAPVNVDRDTDLNSGCLERIYSDVVGKSVLEVGCGRGFLCEALNDRGFDVTGIDMRVPDDVRSRVPEVSFMEANIEYQPFENGSFDTVVCTHTLEHVQHFSAAVAELRRVAARRLIVVVPKQRNYRYTFDLHLHFFSYPHDLVRAMGPHGRVRCCDVVGGDLFYVEDLLEER
jgi:ubiquinone/menaquinone biosynthesis C-methylase UbiE